MIDNNEERVSLADNNQDKITCAFVENCKFNGKGILNNENSRKSFLLFAKLVSTCVCIDQDRSKHASKDTSQSVATNTNRYKLFK